MEFILWKDYWLFITKSGLVPDIGLSVDSMVWRFGSSSLSFSFYSFLGYCYLWLFCFYCVIFYHLYLASICFCIIYFNLSLVFSYTLVLIYLRWRAYGLYYEDKFELLLFIFLYSVFLLPKKLFNLISYDEGSLFMTLSSSTLLGLIF